MNREKYSCYEFEVKKIIEGENQDKYDYRIFGSGCYPYDDGIIESEEWYDTKFQAKCAAIGHIDLLENGEG